MADSFSIEGLDKIITKFQEKEKQAREDDGVSVVVGFSTNYAVYVHENLESFHAVGNAKYLENPARRLLNDGTLADIIREGRKKGLKLIQSLFLAGLRVQREAQEETPVDTGTLKNSAFTEKE